MADSARQGLQKRLFMAGAALLVVAGCAWVGFEVALASAISSASQQADRRLALFDRTLEAIVERFHYMPATVAQAGEVRSLLVAPDDENARDAANGFLSRINTTAGASETFVMSTDGRVVAASNWWAYDSLVGHDFSYRPYFTEAMFDGNARFYAVGIATGVPGYFLAQRIETADGTLGVAVTKINLGEIEANWWRSGELISIVDAQGVVILSTRPDWRYRSLAPRPNQPPIVDAALRYGDDGMLPDPVTADIWSSRGTDFAYVAGQSSDVSGYFVLDELRLPTHQWRLVSFTPMGPLVRSGWTMAAASGLGAAAILLIFVLLWQRQRFVTQRLAAHERLEQRVAERTEDLHAMNEQLRAEIAERVRAEQAEQQAQHGLVQAAKMASLGQALAGVAHEVSQPVSALATQIASARLIAERGGHGEIVPILGAMNKAAERLVTLTGHLKTFSRKETRVAMQADPAGAIANALDLADHKLRQFGIDVHYRRPEQDLFVAANPVHLEQVLLNLIANAADAMENAPVRVLSLAVELRDEMVEVAVSDTGAGIAAAEMGSIFDPFYTTKQAGRGLGLGLSISYGLVRDSGGAITVESRPGKGATFTVRLPLASELLAPAPPSPLRGAVGSAGPSTVHQTTPTAALPSKEKGRKTQPYEPTSK